jgi:hypothetical protein
MMKTLTFMVSLLTSANAFAGALGSAIVSHPTTTQSGLREGINAVTYYDGNGVALAVTVVTDSGYAITVPFVFEASARSFYEAVQAGKSVDFTNCAHDTGESVTPLKRVEPYVNEGTWAQAFYCSVSPGPVVLSEPEEPKNFRWISLKQHPVYKTHTASAYPGPL